MNNYCIIRFLAAKITLLYRDDVPVFFYLIFKKRLRTEKTVIVPFGVIELCRRAHTAHNPRPYLQTTRGRHWFERARCHR